MDIIEGRVECLKLAASFHAKTMDVTDETILATARKWADFVSPAVKESKNAGQRGADDHLAGK